MGSFFSRDIKCSVFSRNIKCSSIVCFLHTRENDLLKSIYKFKLGCGSDSLEKGAAKLRQGARSSGGLKQSSDGCGASQIVVSRPDVWQVQV